MEPMIFRPVYGTYNATTIKIGSSDPKQIVADVEKIYKKFFPQNPFGYLFLEDKYKSQYQDENRFGIVISIFTVLGIIISCLGLIGLSSYMAFQRTKEIGIRKVLGASLLSIVSLLSFEFVKLVLIAAIISLPIAFFAIDNWLSAYAYRISLNWFLFIPPIILIHLIAAFTMSFYVLRAARTNPAQTLKCE